ncbi:hypothetical protein C3B61_12160 [Cryobacterium zongtaii]|uniref:Uncharacterized protein n=1 Tax=Cryobacterium zongtaii TaxID=1259217 RepID=A0A2S3ZDS1_9MICO|nr:hypothetical protein [Cryobacterium zongtaii]POH64636.1 hypothetical protein C3B61_12160 [Cryobacterium zongtaii]
MLRIRKTRWKVAYIAAGLTVLALNSAAFPHTVTNPIFAVEGILLYLLLYFGGVRSFRGADEPVEPPRAWWRMTSRPRAGFVVGSLLVLSVANWMFSVATGATDVALAGVLGVIADALLAFLYFRSSVRLHRVPPRIVPQRTVQDPPQWKPIRR